MFENLLDKDLESRYVSAAKNLEFDEYLAAYPYEKYQLWNDSSNYIDQALLDKLELIGDKGMHAIDAFLRKPRNLLVNDICRH